MALSVALGVFCLALSILAGFTSAGHGCSMMRLRHLLFVSGAGIIHMLSPFLVATVYEFQGSQRSTTFLVWGVLAITHTSIYLFIRRRR